MYIAVRYLVGITSILWLGLNLNADFVGENDSFEGILRYELKTGTRVWTLEHQVKAGKTCTDIYLNDLKFQSVLSTDDGQFLIDVLGKRILPLGGSCPGMGPEPHGNNPSDVMPPRSMDGHPPPESGRSGMDPMLEDAEPPEGEGDAFGKTSLKFEFEAEKREIRLEGIAGYGFLPNTVYQQFEDLRDVGPKIASSLHKYELLPVDLNVEARKKLNAVSLRLLTIDNCEIADSTFELPTEYSMKMGAPGGPQGSSGRGRGGPLPGGGAGGRRGPPPGGSL